MSNGQALGSGAASKIETSCDISNFAREPLHETCAVYGHQFYKIQPASCQMRDHR